VTRSVPFYGGASAGGSFPFMPQAPKLRPSPVLISISQLRNIYCALPFHPGRDNGQEEALGDLRDFFASHLTRGRSYELAPSPSLALP
jgi:hypothetical protein